MIHTINCYLVMGYDHWCATSLAHLVQMNRTSTNECTFIAVHFVCWRATCSDHSYFLIHLPWLVISEKLSLSEPHVPTSNGKSLAHAERRHILTRQILLVCIFLVWTKCTSEDAHLNEHYDSELYIVIHVRFAASFRFCVVNSPKFSPFFSLHLIK
jgi:hypothetical protein